MAIFIPEFRREADASSPLESIISGLTQGAEKGLAYRRQQALDKEESEMNQLKKALLAAQTEKARRPTAPTLTNYEKALQGLDRVRQTYGENSEEYKNAQEYARRLAQGSGGMEFSVDPKTGAVSFSQGRSGASQKVVDGKLINIPTTAAATQVQATTLANKVREDLAKDFNQPYMGSGSNFKLAQDLYKYNVTKDPKTKKELGKKLVDAAVADKIAPEYAFLQLMAQQVRPTVTATEKQLSALTQGWAEGLELAVNNLPPELQKEAKDKHDKLLEKLNQARSQFVAQGMPIDLINPLEEKETQEDKVEVSETVRIMAPNGKVYPVPKEKVEEALKLGGKRA